MAETPYLSVLSWGINAFDLTNIELFKFLEMHGHTFVMETDLARYYEAMDEAHTMPSWPKDGYIREMEEYIIVKLGDVR